MGSTDYLLNDDGTDPWSLLPSQLARKSIAIRDYMIGDGRNTTDPNQTLTALSEMIVEAGLPIDRCVTIVDILNAETTASMRVWNRGQGSQYRAFAHGPEAQRGYEESPAYPAHQHMSWVAFNPQEVPDDAFGVVPDLKAEGFTHYLCAPVVLANAMRCMFSFSTKADGGFTARDVAFLRATFPAIAACQEILVVHRLLREVTRMYVGEEPHKRILAGDVRRGEVSRIESAILFADMRSFTALTANLAAEETTALLNDYYDCIVPHVEAEGGEVLKFIGDGILGIFQPRSDRADAAARALRAARQGLAAVATRSETAATPFDVGIALHFGEIAYGNVGSGMRLDYTVIGRDVNLASRIAGLCGTLGQPLLVSSDIRTLAPEEAFEDCGSHDLKGLAEPQTVFAPRL